MIDTAIAVRGVVLLHNGERFEIVRAGFANDIPYGEVNPRNETVEEAIVSHIRMNMPFPFSVEEIQKTLTNR